MSTNQLTGNILRYIFFCKNHYDFISNDFRKTVGGHFDNSTRDFVKNQDFDQMNTVLLASQHLKENILNVEAINQTNRKCRGGQFKHTLEIKMLVKTGKLWVNPRQLEKSWPKIVEEN